MFKIGTMSAGRVTVNPEVTMAEAKIRQSSLFAEKPARIQESLNFGALIGSRAVFRMESVSSRISSQRTIREYSRARLRYNVASHLNSGVRPLRSSSHPQSSSHPHSLFIRR